MIADLASVFALDACGIDHMVDVSVREQQQPDFSSAAGEPISGILRRID
jgi:hypothetical protein